MFSERLAEKWLISRLALSPEAMASFALYGQLLLKWQKVQNLVSRETLNSLWARHFLDSAVIHKIASEPGSWVDIGSGAGLPGIVTAIIYKDKFRGDAIPCVHLVESNTRKVAFLRAVIRELGLTATVHDCRIEEFDKWDDVAPDYISARALSSLQQLLTYTFPALSQNATAYFHKGREIDVEIEEAANSFEFDLVKYPNPSGIEMFSDVVIAEVSSVRQKF